MPCYFGKVQQASESEFKKWVEWGYTNSFDDYLLLKSRTQNTEIIFSGELGLHCSDCNGVGDYLCDYPVGDGKTCDRSICGDHGVEVAHEIHYCTAHYKMWTKFRDGGGVDAALKNVIAFKSER